MSRLLLWLNWLEDSLLVLLLSFMIILAALQIGLRNIWDSGFVWGDPLLRILVMWLGLLGAMAATRLDNHIRIDIGARYLSSGLRSISNRFVNLFSAAICALLAYHGARFVWLDWESDTMAFAQIPAWLCELIIPVGFGVMALRFLVLVFSSSNTLKRP